MNYELIMTRTSVRLYERVGFTRCMDFPNNYELCITHYELQSPLSALGKQKRDAVIRRLYIQNILEYHYPTSQPLATSLLGEITTSLPSLFTADMIIP